nr:hypothetical protein BaRGS_027011 [Batillaria attramentaria]
MLANGRCGLADSAYRSGFGNLDATLAIHASQFKLNAFVLGVLFMIVAALYAMTSPFYGWLSDTKDVTYPLLIGGNITVGVSLLIMGPSPLLPFLSV